MFMKTRFIHFIWPVCLILIPNPRVWSQSTIYYDPLTFQLAAQNVPGNHQSISAFPPVNGPAVTISNLTFRGGYLIGSPDGLLWNFDSEIPLTIHFANGARAFGANFSSVLLPSDPFPFTATLSLDNGETFRFTAFTALSFTFFGFISATPIMDVTFSDGGLFGVDHLHEELIGNIITVTVPEASTLVFLGMGGFFFAAHLLHRRVRPRV
jgi:hypothetical protein